MYFYNDYNVCDMFYFTLALDPALVGLSLVYTISLVGLFQYVVILSAEVEGLVCIYINYTSSICIL